MDKATLMLADIPQEAWEHICEDSPNQDMQTLIGILKRAPEAAARMAAHGIPQDIINATFADIGLWARRCKRQQGHWGLANPSPGWLENHLACKIFRVGRIQCIPRYFGEDWNVRFYRNKKTGQAVALTAGEQDFRADGQVSGTGGIYAGDDGFKGFFQENEAEVSGIKLSPAGYAEKDPVTLKLDQWALALTAGMPVLELHIPVDGDFEMETCHKTFVDMAAFAKNHREGIAQLTGIEGPFAAFTLGSWIINKQLDGILPPESRLVQHLRQYYLLPVLCGEDSEMFWIFDGRKIDLNNLKPEDTQTSLQRRVIDFIRAGNKLRYNRGIVLMDDADKFGQGFYGQ